MPRTKRPVKKQEKTVEDDEVSKKFNNLVADLKQKIDACQARQLRALELSFKILQDSIGNDYLTKTIGQLKNELYLPEIGRNTMRTASHDDGYLTENSSQSSGGNAKNNRVLPSQRSTTKGRRSRSVDASSRKGPPSTVSKTSNRRRSRSVYQTPSYNKYGNYPNYPVITPKVTPHAPLTIVRQPRQGEMVVSMSGSPVVVPTCYSMQPDEKANCNILLQDGTTLSLQPKQLRQSQAFIPFSLMDEDVLVQLKTLQDNLGKLVKMGEKAKVKVLKKLAGYHKQITSCVPDGKLKTKPFADMPGLVA